MRQDDGRIVLMDFGTGTDRRDAAAADMSGTPLYVAPEVLAGEPASARSDIYSLGVLLYHLLTGSYPVEARTLAELRVAHASDERRDIRQTRADVPLKLARVIARAIDRRPEQRHDSASELAADLAATMPRPVLTRRAKVIGIAAAIALVAGGASLSSLWTDGGWRVTADTPLLAVLPFKDLGGDANSGPVADGLTVGLIQELARIDGLLVNSLQSSLEYKDASPAIADVGRTLGAGYVVTGSVQVMGGIVRASAQLVRAPDGTPLWSDHFDRPLLSAQQVFQVRDEIARAISNKLRLTLGRGQRRYDETTLPLALYYQWVHAETLLARRGKASASQAVQLFQAITMQEPGFAPAWAGLAAALGEVNRLASPETGPPSAELIEKLRQAATKAIDLDPMLAEGHAAIGAVLAAELRWAEAEAAFTRSLALNPSRATTYTDFALSTLLPLLKQTDALQLLEQARRVDPTSLDVIRVAAIIQVTFGRYEAAIQACQDVLARDATIPFARKTLGRALGLSGKLDEALAIFKSDPEEWAMLAWVHARMGHRDEAEAIAAQHPDRPGRVMLIYAGLGDAERAFAEFSRFSAASSVWLAMFQLQRPEAALLWPDPRVTEIRRKFGLPPL
jgi:TolB-like protein